MRAHGMKWLRQKWYNVSIQTKSLLLMGSMLAAACAGALPQEILHRKKSPYPKTYDPAYEAILSRRLREVLADSGAPVNRFLDQEKCEAFLASPKDYGRPWFGQLMAGPQMAAYMLQINFWMETYGIG